MKEDIKMFFKIFIKGFLLGDIKFLNQIKPNSETQLEGCTIPLAMAIISGADLLGYIFGDNKKVDESECHITEFYGIINPQFHVPYDSETISKIVSYRHGMMHNFFPKFKNNSVGICKNESSSLFIKNNEFESLNVTQFAKDFIIGVEYLEKKVEDQIENEFFLNINKALSQLGYVNNIAKLNTQMTTMNILTKNKRN